MNYRFTGPVFSVQRIAAIDHRTFAILRFALCPGYNSSISEFDVRFEEQTNERYIDNKLCASFNPFVRALPDKLYSMLAVVGDSNAIEKFSVIEYDFRR